MNAAAVECYDKTIKIDPNYAAAWNSKGITLYHSGKYNEAVECYDKAINVNPNYTDACYNKGTTLRKLGKQNDADRCFASRIQIIGKICKQP
jgi:tetratricopeptide (TPR) repeat protein